MMDRLFLERFEGQRERREFVRMNLERLAELAVLDTTVGSSSLIGQGAGNERLVELARAFAARIKKGEPRLSRVEVDVGQAKRMTVRAALLGEPEDGEAFTFSTDRFMD